MKLPALSMYAMVLEPGVNMKKTSIILLIILILTSLNYADEKTDAVLKKAAEYQQSGDHEKAVAEAEKIFGMTGDKKTIADACRYIGYSQNFLGRYQLALDNYLKSSKYYTDDVGLIENIILCYNNLKDYAGLEKFGLLKISEFPDNLKIKAMVYIYLLRLKINTDKYLDEAVKVEARLPDGDSDLCYSIACVYSINRDVEKSVMFLDRSIYYCFDDIDKLAQRIDWMQQDGDLNNIRSNEYYKNLLEHRQELFSGIKAYYEAKEYYDKNNYDNALSSYLKALDLFTVSAGDKSLWVAACFNNLGLVYGNKGDYDRALGSYERALAIRLEVLGEKHSKIAVCYYNIGSMHDCKRDYNRAIEYYKRAVAIQVEVHGENNTATLQSYNTLAAAYSKKSDYGNAVLVYRKVLDISLILFGVTDYRTALSYSNLGSVYFDMGDYSDAISYYEKALKIDLSVYGENNLQTLTDYDYLGSAYLSAGDYDAAINIYEKLTKLVIGSYGDRHHYLVDIYNKLGRVYSDKADYNKAKDYYERAFNLSLEIAGENHILTAGCYNNIGTLYSSIGDNDKAIYFHNKALTIFQKIPEENGNYIALTCNYLGLRYHDKSNYNEALFYYKQALDLRIKIFGENHPVTGESYNNIAGYYRDIKDYDKAITSFSKSIQILGDENPLTSIGYSNLAAVYNLKKEYDNAIYFYNRALTISSVKFGKNHPQTAICYHGLGVTYENKGEIDKAIEHKKKALIIIDKSNDYQTILWISRSTGCTYSDAGYYKQSLVCYSTGIETIEKVRRFNLSGGIDFTSRNISSYYYAASACYLDKNMETMFNISERMRSMGYLERLSLNAAIESAGLDPEQGKKLLKLKDDIERLSSYRQKLISADIFSMNDQQKKERDRHLEETGKQLAAAEDEFNKIDVVFMKNEKYKLLRDSSVVSVKTSQEMCGSERAIIEYIIPEKPDKYMKPYAIIITGSTINAVELDSSYNYTGKIEKYRKSIKENRNSETDGTGTELYSKLIAPVESFINSNTVRKIIIVPDGSLAFLPFDSLKTKDGKYLSERYEVSLTPSITVSTMIRNRRYDKRDNLIALGGGIYSSNGEGSTRGQPSFRGIEIELKDKEKLALKAYNTPLEYYTAQQLRWADLPGTEREVAAINEKIYGKKNTEIYTGLNVSEANLKSFSKNGNLKKFSSIHLACHGYYDPEYPAYSAVVFSEVSGKLKDSNDDGYMSVEETALLSLQSEIVVLSACETGLGRMVSGDGVIGLTRAFQVAGSNRVLVTLWPVSDEATEAFMISFYAKVRAGMSYSRALVRVKEEFRRSDGSGASGDVDYSAPYYWAGFVLYE